MHLYLSIISMWPHGCLGPGCFTLLSHCQPPMNGQPQLTWHLFPTCHVTLLQGEMALEEFLKQVREKWNNYELELIAYQVCTMILTLFVWSEDLQNSKIILIYLDSNDEIWFIPLYLAPLYTLLTSNGLRFMCNPRVSRTSVGLSEVGMTCLTEWESISTRFLPWNSHLTTRYTWQRLNR